MPLRQLRAYNGAVPTSHEREFKASTHIHDSVETAVKNALTRTSSIGGHSTEAKIKNLQAMRTSEKIRPKLKYEALPGLPEPHTGTRTSTSMSDLGGVSAVSSRQQEATRRAQRHAPVNHGSSLMQSGSLKDGRVSQKDWLRLQSGNMFEKVAGEHHQMA